MLFLFGFSSLPLFNSFITIVDLVFFPSNPPIAFDCKVKERRSGDDAHHPAC